MNAQELRLIHLREQANAMLEEHYNDIARIDQNGPNGSMRDVDIIRMVFCVVQGQICERKAAAL